MTMDRVDALHRDWEKCPPMRVSLAIQIGWKAKESRPLSELRAMFPNGMIR